jgi:iron complex transport system ATP-binding protein
MDELLEARQLDFTYRDGPHAVRNVSLTASPGSMLAIIGANGSGKSTLIRMLAGLLRPSTGKILLRGSQLQSIEPKLRAREIAYVPQTMTMVFPFRVIEVVLTGRTPHLEAFQIEQRSDYDKALEALEMVGAAHLADRPFTALSGGERQMVILARALAQQPSLLLLDEPSASLDLKHRASLIRTLAGLRESRNLSVIMITHDLQLTGTFFDRILALRCGEVTAQGSPEEVLTSRLLAEIYDEPAVRAQRFGSQTFVWMEQ